MGLGVRQIARSLSLAHSTVGEYLGRAGAAGLSWPLPEDMDEARLEALLFPGNSQNHRKCYAEPDFALIHRELRRKGVTMQLLWQEYKRENSNGYQYSRFCELYQEWSKTLDLSMRQVHRAGEKMFVDWAGQTVPVTDMATGEKVPAYVFVAVLGASNYTYVEVSLSMDLFSWITAHCNAFEFFGGVPEIVVPDNTKTAVNHTCRYEPELNPTYREMAAHYGTAVIPARPRKPRDKSKAETSVRVVESWVLAPLRNRTFFSLAELKEAIRSGVHEMNSRPFQKLEGSRRTLFETLDRPALKPLPLKRYEFAVWKKARVNIDYHIEVEHNYYSVPYQLAQKEVDVRVTSGTVEVLHKGRRVALHPRSYGKGRFNTDPNHRPEKHQKYLEWTPSRLVSWAQTVGSDTARLVQVLLESRPHPEQCYRSCLGIMSLSKKYSHERLDAACRRALAIGAISYRSVKSILEKGLDQIPPEDSLVTPQPVQHVNLRGPGYYSQKGVLPC
jgi:transposase